MYKWLESHPLIGGLVAVLGFMALSLLLMLILGAFGAAASYFLRRSIVADTNRIVLAAEAGAFTAFILWLAPTLALGLGWLSERQKFKLDRFLPIAITLVWAIVFVLAK